MSRQVNKAGKIRDRGVQDGKVSSVSSSVAMTAGCAGMY